MAEQDPIVFDHVALAVRRMTDPWPVFADALGGRYVDRGINPGFGWTQLRFAHGFILEGLHPELTDQADFLTRFLDASGPGPAPPDLQGARPDRGPRRARAAGFDPVGETLRRPGMVRGLPAPAPGARCGRAVGPGRRRRRCRRRPSPRASPSSPSTTPSRPSVAWCTRWPTWRARVQLFRDLLGGTVMSTGAAVDGNHWVELGWSGPGRLRLLEGAHAEIAEWIDGRAGRLRHLFFNFDEPSHVPGRPSRGRGSVGGRRRRRARHPPGHRLQRPVDDTSERPPLRAACRRRPRGSCR